MISVQFFSGPLNGETHEISSDFEVILCDEPATEGQVAAPGQILYPNQGTWEYRRAVLGGSGQIIYVGQKVESANSVALPPAAWTQAGPFDIYNPTEDVVTATVTGAAVQFSDWRVRRSY